MNPRFFVSFVATFLIASSAGALCGNVCEVSLRPHVTTVPLVLEGWLYEDADAVTVTVIDEPRFGSWLGYVYTPRMSFWQVGGDRVRLMVEENATGHKSYHTLVLKVAEVVAGNTYSESFESGDILGLEPDWDTAGATGVSLTSSDPIAGSYSLEVDHTIGISGGGRVERADGGTGKNGIDQMSGSAIINASPPTFGLLDFAYTVVKLEDFVTIRLIYENEQYWVQGSVSNVACPHTPCATNRLPILPDRDYQIFASIGVRGVGHPFLESSNSFDLTVIDMETNLPSRHLLANLGSLQDRSVPAPTSTIGAFDASGTGSAVVRLDDFTYQEGRLNASRFVARVEDFAEGQWSPEWLAVGPVHGAASGRFGSGTAEQDDGHGFINLSQVPTGIGEAMWIDLEPHHSAATWIHLQIKSEQLELGQWGVFHILEGRKQSGQSNLYLQLRANGALDFQIRAQARDATGECQPTGWVDLPTDISQVDLIWHSQTGWLQLWVDDEVAAELNLLPSDYRVDEIGLGVTKLSPGAGSLPPSSRLMVDDFMLLYEKN